jgi:hypothetical protein
LRFFLVASVFINRISLCDARSSPCHCLRRFAARAIANGERPAASMRRDVGAGGVLLFEVGRKVNAHVDACTHERDLHDSDYDGALEAEPRLLKQTRKFVLGQRARGVQTFQAPHVRRCDAHAPDGDTRVPSQNLPTPIQFQSHWWRRR